MRIQQSGVTHNDTSLATPGLTLFSPVQSQTAYLIDNAGEEVRCWTVTGSSTNWCYLTNGDALFMNESGEHKAAIPFGSGAMRSYAPNCEIGWTHEDRMQDHDARRLPDGGCVYLAWEKLSRDTAAELTGGVPGTDANGEIFGEVIREVDATGGTRWEWRLSEHGCWPFHRNAVRRNYGHANAIDISPEGDYPVSFKVLNLLLIISRETGDIVWEFQNDALDGQHDAQFTDTDSILVFANVTYSSDVAHSQVWEIDRATKNIVWRFTEKQNPLNFFSAHLSDVQRLPSGRTLICEGANGCLMEMTPGGEIAWQNVNPHWQTHPKFNAISRVYRARRYTYGAPEVARYV